jgi:hypothetical protein
VNVERGCRSKQAYLSKNEAKRVVRFMGARHREAFHLYACPACRYWHVGHVIPSGIRAHLVPNWQRRAVQLGSF